MGEGPADRSHPKTQWQRHDAFEEVVAHFSGGMRTEQQQLHCMVQVSNASGNMGRASNIDCSSSRDYK